MTRKPPHNNFIPKYTREQKQVFFDTLRDMKGDVRGAAKKCGFSASAVRYWITKADPSQLDSETAKLVTETKGDVYAHLDRLLFRVLNSAEKSLVKATLPQKMEAAQKIVLIMKSLKNPPRETPDAAPSGPEQTAAEMELLAMINKVERRREQDEISEKPN